MPTFLVSLVLFLATSSLVCCHETLINDSIESGPESDESSAYHGDDIVRFSKRIYSVLKTNPIRDTANLATEFKKEYKHLNEDGMVGSMLGALYDMRLEDLLISVEHVRKMKELLETLDS